MIEYKRTQLGYVARTNDLVIEIFKRMMNDGHPWVVLVYNEVKDSSGWLTSSCKLGHVYQVCPFNSFDEAEEAAERYLNLMVLQ